MLEILKNLPLKYFDVFEPNIFQAIKYYPENESYKIIQSLQLLDKVSLEKLNNKTINSLGDNLLLDCMIKGKLQLTELLLASQKFDLSYENSRGENALYYMAYYHLRSEKILYHLINQNAPVGSKGLANIVHRILHGCHESLLGDKALTDFLIAYKVDCLKVYTPDYDPQPINLLDYAESHYSSTCIKAILNTNTISYEILEKKLNTLESSSFPNQFKMHVYNKMMEMEKNKLEYMLEDKELEKPNKAKKI